MLGDGIVNLLSHNDIDAKPVFGLSWLVSVKEGKTELSSAGRSEIVKVLITFQNCGRLCLSAYKTTIVFIDYSV